MHSATGSESLAIVLEQLVRWLRSNASTQPLTSAAASLLGRLDVSDGVGVTPLAKLEGVSQPAMTQLVDRLAADGLVERSIPEHNRRTTLVSITASGRTAIAERRAWRAAHIAEIMQNLSDNDQAAIVAALPALQRLADAATDVQRA